MNEILWRALCAEMAKPGCPVPRVWSGGGLGFEFGGQNVGERNLLVTFDRDEVTVRIFTEHMETMRHEHRAITDPAELVSLIHWVTSMDEGRLTDAGIAEANR